MVFYTQPKQDKELTSSLRWPLTDNKDNLRRGYMVWDKSPKLPQGYDQAATVEFLFNPTEISASYSVQFQGAAKQFPNLNDTALLKTGLNQAMSFTLLFDRTYAFFTNKGGDLANLGVDVDVRAMRQFTGMYVNAKDQAQANGGGSFTVSQGIMGQIPSYVFFSGVVSHGLIYYGFIDSWDVTYTHFTNKMVPVRCSVDVSFTLLPPPSQTNNKPGTIPPPVTVIGGTGGPGNGPQPIPTGPGR